MQLVEQGERWAEHVEASAPPGVRVRRWLGTWLSTPAPALGGHAPLTLLETADGRRLVGDLLGSLESGAYW